MHADDNFDRSGLQVPAGTINSVSFGRTRSCVKFARRPEKLDSRSSVISARRSTICARTPTSYLPAEWMGCETGDTANDPINFRFYWLPLSQGHVLAAGQGALLGRLFD